VKGKTPTIRVAGGWATHTVAGAISCTAHGNKPKEYARIADRPVRTNDVARFVRDLKRHEQRPLVIIMDRLAAHRSAARALEGEPGIRIEWFPAYAPELNPQEYVWSSVKTRDLGNLRAEGMEEVDRHVRRGMRRMQRSPDVLRGCLKASTLFDKELSS
jgi:hypothetical protein